MSEGRVSEMELGTTGAGAEGVSVAPEEGGGGGGGCDRMDIRAFHSCTPRCAGLYAPARHCHDMMSGV